MAGVSGSSTARSASLSLGWINPDPGGVGNPQRIRIFDEAQARRPRGAGAADPGQGRRPSIVYK